VDSDADVIIWDDTRRQSVSVKSQCSHADLNVYDGMSFCGTATHVVYAGQVVVDDEGVCVLVVFRAFSTCRQSQLSCFHYVPMS